MGTEDGNGHGHVQVQGKVTFMNHVSVSPTDGNGPTQGQRKTLTRVGIEPTTFGLDLRRSTD